MPRFEDRVDGFGMQRPKTLEEQKKLIFNSLELQQAKEFISSDEVMQALTFFHNTYKPVKLKEEGLVFKKLVEKPIPFNSTIYTDTIMVDNSPFQNSQKLVLCHGIESTGFQMCLETRVTVDSKIGLSLAFGCYVRSTDSVYTFNDNYETYDVSVWEQHGSSEALMTYLAEAAARLKNGLQTRVFDFHTPRNVRASRSSYDQPFINGPSKDSEIGEYGNKIQFR